MLPKLEALLRTRQICAIGIHGAELLDDLTMEWLKDLHDSCGQQFAFLLGGQLNVNESRDTPFRKIIKHLPAPRPAAHLLAPIGEGEFRGVVLARLLKGLDAKLAPELHERHKEFSEEFWLATQGNWHAIWLRVKLFDRVLLPDSRSPRLISQTVVDEVNQRTAGLGVEMEVTQKGR